MAVCKPKAIQIDDLSYDNFFDLPENKVEYNTLMDFFATRRSVRNFKDKPVPNEVIQQILDSIAFAPYGSSPNTVNITAVNNRKIIESALPLMSEFYDNLVKWIDNPVIRFVFKKKKDPETYNTVKNHVYPIAKLGNYKLEHGDRITRNAPALLIFHANKGAEAHTHNAIIYATYAMLAAQAQGLGTTMISLVPAAINKVNALKELFKIPEDNEAVISLILGYPKIKYKRAIRRDKKPISWVE
jgi:nitroreductase